MAGWCRKILWENLWKNQNELSEKKHRNLWNNPTISGFEDGLTVKTHQDRSDGYGWIFHW